MMKITNKVSVFLAALFLTVGLQASMSARFEVADYVTGVHDQATVQVYVSTGPEGYGIANFGLKFTLPAGVTATANDIVFGNIFRPTITNFQKSSTGSELVFLVIPPVGDYIIDSSATELLYATVNLTIDPAVTGTATVTSTLQGLQRGYSGGYITYTPDNTDPTKTITSPATFDIPILKGFNFATKAGQEVSIAEDANATTPFALFATNTTYFESTEWSEAQSQLVAVVPPQAQFIGFSLTDPTVVRADYVTSFNDEKGTFSIVGGTIQYTQAANYFNADGFTVWYEVQSTSGVTGGATDTGSILVKVTPVNDAPVVNIVTISGQDPIRALPALSENQHMVVTIEVTDVENDLFDINSITLGGNSIAGDWAADFPVRDTGNLTPGRYVFTSTDPLSYDMVIHPAMTRNLPVAVQITDQGTPVPESASASQDVTINDADRPQSDPVIQSITPAAPLTTDDVVVDHSMSVDPDNDTITTTIEWYKDGVFVELGDTLSAANTSKGEVFEARVWSTTYPYETDPVISAVSTQQVTILNSAPVAQDKSVFIRKMPNAGVVQRSIILNATDADYFTDTLTYSEVTGPTKGTLNIVGNIAFYTITDPETEFYGENADTFTFKATDDDDTPADSNIATVTITYRENPPAEVVSTGAAFGSTVQVAEVDENGDPGSVTFGITATDDTQVTPAGIKKIAWSVAPEVSRTPAAWTVNPPEVTFPEPWGDVTQAQQCTITLPGYDTIDGSPRPLTGNFTVTVTVTDALDVDTVETWTVQVSDVDRKPTAPTSIAFNPNSIVADTEVTATADGGADDDGDAVTYEYKWFTKAGETYTLIFNGATMPAFHAAIFKGNTLYVRAYSVTTPYTLATRNGFTTVLSDDYLEASITVGNTAPVFSSFGPENATTVYNWVMNEDCATQNLVIDDTWVNDIDVTDAVDTLTYAISSLGSEVGTLTYDANTKTISFTPALNVNKDNLLLTRYDGSVYPSFEVSVSDADASAAAPAIVNIEIIPVNDPPVLDAIPGTIYIVPDQMGTEWTATYTISMGGGTDEETQAIDNVLAAAPTGADIFATAPVAVKGAGDHDVTITFTVDAAAALGSEAEFEITVTDDGVNGSLTRVLENDNTTSKIIKVVLGATPWYPIFTLPCTAHPIHQVTILDGATTVAELIVEGDTLKPADYYNAGCPGLPSGAEYTVELRSWTASAGVGPVCTLPPEAPLNALDLNVPAYNLPGKGILTFADVRAENKVFRINTPLSASYTLTITNTTTGTVKTVTRDFTPNPDGLILPEVDLSMDFFVPGDYVATVFGTNPEGDGEESDPLAFTINDGSQDTLVWPAQGFVPADAANILVPQNVPVATVNFSWPVLSAALSYNIVVINSAGAVVARASDLTGNTWKAENLPAPKDFNSYAWWVEAVSADQNAVSFTWGFNVIKQTSAPLLNSVSAGDTGVILNFDSYDGDPALVRYEVQYFSVDPVNIKNSKWYTFMMPDAVQLNVAVGRDTVSFTGGRLELGLPVASKAGDFILLRAFVNNLQQGNFVLYSVQ